MEALEGRGGRSLLDLVGGRAMEEGRGGRSSSDVAWLGEYYKKVNL